MKLLQIVKLHAHPNTFMRTCICLRKANTLTHISDPKGEDVTVRDIKQTKEPFVKNLFLGNFDTDILTFPEVLDINQLKDLENKIAPLENIFTQNNSSCNSQQKLIETKALGLFGLQVPEEYGGLNLNATEYARYCEIISQDGPAAISLNAHQTYGLKGLLIAGNKQQKQEYLPRLASGEWVAAFCFAEPSGGVNTFGVDTKATLSEQGDKWYINGSKILINGDGNADLMTVIALTDKEEFDGKKTSTLTAFLVERTFAGVSFNKTADIVGNRGANISEVTFKNTPVPINNVLGEIGDGFKLSADILGNNRFSAGSFAAGILKRLLERVSEHCINQKQLGKKLMDFELIQEKVANISFSIYILESLTYLTAGLVDNYDCDTSVESAIVKVMSSEMLSNGILECQNILGGMEFFKNYAYDMILRDSKVYMLLEGSNEVLRMFIALSGLQHAGNKMKDDVEKLRNPAMNPGYVFKKMFERKYHIKDNPKLTLGLDGYVHPSLGNAAQQLEYGVLRLQFVVEILLARHGRGIIEKEIELNRLTDIVMGLYVMTAVLARASRSYCTGLQDSDFEVNIALTTCQNILEMVKQKVKHIQDGPILCYEHNYKTAAEKIFSHRGYFLEHPLSRNIF